MQIGSSRFAMARCDRKLSRTKTKRLVTVLAGN